MARLNTRHAPYHPTRDTVSLLIFLGSIAAVYAFAAILMLVIPFA